MPGVSIATPRLLLRDVREADRPAFIAYQHDPRYLRLYDLDAADARRAEDLFDLFLAWQAEQPRANLQLGIFDPQGRTLWGTAGLRKLEESVAALGIELAPSQWGRFRLALDVVVALLDHGFGPLGLHRVVGDTASGNRRVEKLARRLGARVVARRPGPAWMGARGWVEVEWALDRDAWTGPGHDRRGDLLARIRAGARA